MAKLKRALKSQQRLSFGLSSAFLLLSRLKFNWKHKKIPVENNRNQSENQAAYTIFWSRNFVEPSILWCFCFLAAGNKAELAAFAVGDLRVMLVRGSQEFERFLRGNRARE